MNIYQREPNLEHPVRILIYYLTIKQYNKQDIAQF